MNHLEQQTIGLVVFSLLIDYFIDFDSRPETLHLHSFIHMFISKLVFLERQRMPKNESKLKNLTSDSRSICLCIEKNLQYSNLAK